MESATQALATNITLVTISLLVPSLMALGPAWTRFKRFLITGPRDARRTVWKVSVIAFAPPALLFASGLIAVSVSPSEWDLAWRYVAVGLVFAVMVPVLISTTIRWLFGRRRPADSAEKPTHHGLVEGVGATTSLVSLLLTVFITLWIIVSVVPFAVDAHIGGVPILENFEFAKAMLLVVPFALVNGMTWLGLCYCAELFEPEFDAPRTDH